MANGQISGPPAVDFYSMLSGLGDTLQQNAAIKRKAEVDEARRGAFSDFTALDPASPDYGKQAMTIAQRLGQAGDQEGAYKFLGAAQTAASKAADDAWRRQESERAQRNADRSFGLQDRQFRASQDKTPTNFIADPSAPGGYRPIGPADPEYQAQVAAAKARAAASAPPEGFMQGPDGALVPRAGGPTDPAYLAKVDAEKARARGDQPTIIGPGSSVIVPNKANEGPVFTNKVSGGGLSDDALNIRAAQWNAGDYEGATKNVGRGAQGGATLEAIANRAAEQLIAQGHTPDQAAAAVSANMQKFRASGIGQNAESRTSATREANLNLILKATDAAIPAALEQSEKVSRTGWVPLNKVIQGGQVMASDPELRKFGMANLQLAEHWARAMNPTGVMRESDRDLALHFLSTADSKETYKQAVNQLKVQITRERDAVRGGTHTPAAPAAAQPNVTKAGVPWSVE